MYEGKETEFGTFEKAEDEDSKAILKETIYNIQQSVGNQPCEVASETTNDSSSD